MTAVMATAIGFAQTADFGPMKKAELKVKKAEIATKSSVRPPFKSFATGNYYTRPEGSMYVGFTKETGFWAPTLLVMTPNVTGVFVNKNANPNSATWYINGNDYSAYADESNNLPYMVGPVGLQYYAPELVNGADTYTLPNNYEQTKAEGSYLLGGLENAMQPLTYTPLQTGMGYYGYGALDTYYYFGSGGITYQGENGMVNSTSFGAEQHFEKPMSPLYVQDVYLRIVTAQGDTEPLKNGATLRMMIIDDNDNIIAELTAGAEDLTPLGQQYDPDYYGDATLNTLTFSKKELDPVSQTMTTVPFVIDEAFTVLISGFDNADVNVGLFGYQCMAEDNLEPAHILVRSNDTGEEGYLTYNQNANGENISMEIMFNGILDNAQVLTSMSDQSGNVMDNLNVLRISEDGQTCNIENYPDPSVMVFTAYSWQDAQMNDVYRWTIGETSEGEGLADWILGMDVDTSSWADMESEYMGYNFVSFTAEPINAGEGRWAKVYIQGRGVTSTDPIILLQGTATLDDVPSTGIENAVVNNNVKADPNAPVYNLNGQRVSKSTKGILIQNGKKFINK